MTVIPHISKCRKLLAIAFAMTSILSAGVWAQNPYISETPAPLVIEFSVKEIESILAYEHGAPSNLAHTLADLIEDTAAHNGHRTIALRLLGAPLGHEHLSSIQRNALRSLPVSPNEADHLYQIALNKLLAEALDRCSKSTRKRFGIIGIPFEAHGRSNEAAQLANTHYATTLNRVGVMFPARSFVLSDSTATKALLVRSIPNALAHAGSRRAIVRVNDRWICMQDQPPPLPASETDTEPRLRMFNTDSEFRWDKRPAIFTPWTESGTTSAGLKWTAYHDAIDIGINRSAAASAPNHAAAVMPPDTSDATPDGGSLSEPLDQESGRDPTEDAESPLVYDESDLWNESVASQHEWSLNNVGLEEEPSGDLALNSFRIAWATGNLSYDLNSDGHVDRADLAILLELIPTPVPKPAKRLLHFQSVGFSSLHEFGYVSASTCTPEEGWNAHIDQRLTQLVERLGEDSFDWWGHNTGGVWYQQPIQLREGGSTTLMHYEQLFIARHRYPQLVDYAPLQSFAKTHGINLYGYIGFPRCHSGITNTGSTLAFQERNEHGDPDAFMNWYGEFVRYGFAGVGHDWTATLPQDSPWLEEIAPILDQLGMEVFIEAMPARNVGSHLLGFSVVAEHRLWSEREEMVNSSGVPLFYTENEIRAAGGRAVHLITWPIGGRHGEIASDPDFDPWEWRFKTARRLLRNGHTVAVNLSGLMFHGYNIERLAELANEPPPVAQGSP